MVDMDASIDDVSVGWIINDAVALYYKMGELRSTVLYAQQHRRKS